MIDLAIVGLDIGPGSFGGVYNYTKLLIKHIDKKKVKLNYYSLGKSPNWYSGEDKPSLLQFIIGSSKKIIFFFFFLKKNKIKVVHLNSGLTQISLLREGILSLIAKFIDCKTLFLIHGWKDEEFDKLIRNKFKKKIFIKILKKQNSIVVLANHFKEKLIALGIDRKKIFTSSTMVESKKYFTEEKIFSKPYKVLFCANIVREKGPFELLNSIPIVIKRFPETQFIFIGNGKDIKNLKLESEKLVLNKNILFTGYIDLKQKIKFFKESHIFAFPSYYGEGFPTVILEAMAAGLSIITTPNAGLKNAIQDGREGFLLKTMPSKPVEIAERIIKLIENPDIMKDMSKKNIITAQKKYDVEVICDQIYSIYNDIQN